MYLFYGRWRKVCFCLAMIIFEHILFYYCLFIMIVISKCYREKYKGRLHFCSHSLVFVPDDTRYSITRHSFDKIEGGFKKFRPTPSNQPFFSSFSEENMFCFTCTEFVEIRKGNKDHPYIFKKVSVPQGR